jgi:hypothetical protein
MRHTENGTVGRHKISLMHFILYCLIKKIIVAVNGVHNNNTNRDELLNLDIFDVSNNIPINVQFFGEKNKGRYDKIFMEYIKSCRIFKCDSCGK